MKFCILAHVYKGKRISPPHDHGPSWAVYGQVEGVTVMTDWKLLQKPTSGTTGKVEKMRDYELTPGVAHVYNEGVVHSPRRDGDTKLIRIEGRDLTKSAATSSRLPPSLMRPSGKAYQPPQARKKLAGSPTEHHQKANRSHVRSGSWQCKNGMGGDECGVAATHLGSTNDE